MKGFRNWLRFAVAGVALAAATACAPIYRSHGYAPTEDELSLITVGADTQDTVASAIGRPSASGLLKDQGWFYVQSRFRYFGPREPQEIERQVVAISFDEAGVVTNIERFGLEEGRVVTLSRRVTDSTLGGTTLISQLLRNFGHVNASDFIQ